MIAPNDDNFEDRPEDFEVEYDTDPAWEEFNWGTPAERPEVRTPSTDARAAVEGWRIAALGDRPVDQMGRDLLLASLWRDDQAGEFARRRFSWCGGRGDGRGEVAGGRQPATDAVVPPPPGE